MDKKYVPRHMSSKCEISSILKSGISTPLSREWQQEKILTKSKLVCPIFVLDISDEQTEIENMPGIKRYGPSNALEYIKDLTKKGLRSVIIFGVTTDVTKKDPYGTLADSPDGPVITLTKLLKKNLPDLFIICDVCLCEYTSHGHCGILQKDHTINRKKSIKRVASIALAYAKAGASCIAPSDMMDGHIKEIKNRLISSPYLNCLLMAYSAKFCSSLYGPFRNATCSTLLTNRSDYQIPVGALAMARRHLKRDSQEGADVLVIKPSTFSLDIIRDASLLSLDIPLAAFHVSGEYSMLCLAALKSVFDLKTIAFESHNAITRAGALIIISYFTPLFLDWLSF